MSIREDGRLTFDDHSRGAMTMQHTRQILFIQGGGAGSHDERDDKLVDSLRTELGDAFEVRYPRMPAEDDPSRATWGPAIRQELATLEDGAIVVGHSVGATILVNTLAADPPPGNLGAIVLLAAPFVGPGGWPGEAFKPSSELGATLPQGVPVHLFHGTEDDTVPPAHADLYADAIPQAQVHRLPGRDHQLGNDLGDVAGVIRSLEASPAPRSSR
jgi:pimeloyl-ACP methyl ester carboxylesterase